MSEYIKKSEAIKALGDAHFKNWGNACLVISEVPSADVIERRRGEWIDDEFLGQYRCSECDYYSVDEFDFCPNCGADMRSDD